MTGSAPGSTGNGAEADYIIRTLGRAVLNYVGISYDYVDFDQRVPLLWYCLQHITGGKIVHKSRIVTT